MITEKELCKAIEECQEEPITGTKRSALADLFIIYDHLFGKPDLSGYSYDYNPENTIYTNGGTDFLQIVNGKDTEKYQSVCVQFFIVDMDGKYLFYNHPVFR